MISGFFRGGSPRVTADVSLGQLSVSTRTVEFVVDTGAAVSVLHLSVLADLGVDADVLKTLRTQLNLTLAGSVVHAVAEGTVQFSQDDGARLERRLAWRIALTPPIDDGDVPSVLGMDALAVFRVIVSVPENRVALEFP